ncbi:12288_t:CDS:2, partial [Ambispora leptoticha]
MTKLNPILENLQNKVVQELPIKSIYAQNDFAVFDKGASEFYGSEDEFITDQPLEGLGIIMDEVFYTIYNSKKMKQALQGPAQQSALTDRLIDSMKTKAITALNKKIVEIISDKDNYKDTAYNGMDEISTSYNKGYQKPVRDSELNPHKIFKSVIPKKLKNNVLVTIHDEKSVVYRIINPEEIQHEKTLGGGMEKFAYHVEVVGGMIPFTNSWALYQQVQEKNNLLEQKIEDLGKQLISLAKQKLTNQKEAKKELMNYEEQFKNEKNKNQTLKQENQALIQLNQEQLKKINLLFDPEAKYFTEPIDFS